MLMKKILFFLWVLTGMFQKLPAQEIVFFGRYASGDYFKVANNYGLGLGMNFHLTGQTRLSAELNWGLNPAQYRYIYSILGDQGPVDYSRDVSAKNQTLIFTTNIGFYLAEPSKDNVLMGSSFGLTMINYNETGTETDRNETVSPFRLNEWTLPKLTAGLWLEYNRAGKDNTSFFIRFKPELVYFRMPGLMCIYGPSAVFFLNFDVGINFKLRKKRQ